MMTARRDRWPVILGSLIAAVVLTLLPLPPAVEALRPYWVALVMIYWGLETTDMVTLGLAFTIGLVLDLLTGSLLGMHALSLVIVVYLVTRFRARLRFFPPWQQALSVLGLLVNDRIILLWIISLRGEPLPELGFWLPPLVGTLLWPWLFLLLDRYRGFMRQRAVS
jgi:rod shape-determining protein MreD